MRLSGKQFQSMRGGTRQLNDFSRPLRFVARQFNSASVWLLFFLITICSISNACRSREKADMRRLVPAETLVYLETNDVARALEALTENQTFQTLAREKPDFSRLEQVQLAVAVTGFETSEENAALNFKPRFVAVIETHAWSWQAASFAENQIDAFVRTNYGENAKLETTDKNGGKFFTWTAADNRRSFAFARGSLIYFGNDQATIESCLAIRNGTTTATLFANESLAQIYAANSLAFGYVSPAGIREIADLAGVSIAVEATEEAGGRSFIARVLPQIFRGTTEEIVWTMKRTERGIEDVFVINLNPETAAVAREISTPNTPTPNETKTFLPADFYSATVYNLENPSLAWRALLLTTAKNIDALSGKLLVQSSDALLERYGVSKAETFLSLIDSEITTVVFDETGDRSAAIVTVKDAARLKEALSPEFNFRSAPIKNENVDIWLSKDEQMSAAFVGSNLVIGDTESVVKCLRARQNGKSNQKNLLYQRFAASNAVAATVAKDDSSAEKIVAVLGKTNAGVSGKNAAFSLTETRFTERGIERTIVSDFGFAGTILKQVSN